MRNPSRRDFLCRGSLGFASLGVGGLLLRPDAAPTAASGGAGGDLPPDRELDLFQDQQDPMKLHPTENNIQGPFYRAGAPFRAKVTPPLEAGQVLLVRGRVWGHDTKRPLSGVVIDVWQANAKGRYDNDDPKKPPKAGVYRYRARLVTDGNGFYELETILPGRYKNGASFRPAHIHYMVRKRGYRTLVTQLYFKGDPHNDSDPFIKKSLIIDLQGREAAAGAYRSGSFDIVLAKG